MTNPQPDEIERVARALAKFVDGREDDWRDYEPEAETAIAAMDTSLREQIAAKDAENERLRGALREIDEMSDTGENGLILVNEAARKALSGGSEG